MTYSMTYSMTYLFFFYDLFIPFVEKELIYEITECGPYFKEINNFIWPFNLRSPRKGFSKLGKNRSFLERGSYGNWENSINHLIKKMA